MNEEGNLGGERVGSMENSQACYLGYDRMPLTPSSPRKILNSRRFLGHIFDYLSMVAKIKLCSYWCFHEQITMTVLLEYVTALLEYLGFCY